MRGERNVPRNERSAIAREKHPPSLSLSLALFAQCAELGGRKKKKNREVDPESPDAIRPRPRPRPTRDRPWNVRSKSRPSPTNRNPNDDSFERNNRRQFEFLIIPHPIPLALLNRDHDTFLERSHKGDIRGAILHNSLLLGKHVQGRRGRAAGILSQLLSCARIHRSKFPPTNWPSFPLSPSNENETQTEKERERESNVIAKRVKLSIFFDLSKGLAREERRRYST